MYKDRIRKWKIDKKVKGNEMIAILRRTVQRSRVGKKSAFRIRNQNVPEKKIARYRRMKNLFSDDEILRIRAPTPPGFECYTPLASPLSTPRELETPEIIVKSTQDWITGSFDSGRWLTKGGTVYLETKFGNSYWRFYSMSCEALKGVRCGRGGEMWRILNIAMTLIKQVLLAANPHTVAYIITVINWFVLENMLDIAIILLKQFTAMSGTLLPQLQIHNQSIILSHIT